jgi:ComF family protein
MKIIPSIELKNIPWQAQLWGIPFVFTWNTITRYLAPACCIGCSELLPDRKKMGLCATCWGGLKAWDKSLISDPVLPEGVDSFKTSYLYEGALRQFIRHFKFNDTEEYAPALAPLLMPNLPIGEDYVLLAVPMHETRLRKRMYNQSAYLVESLVDEFLLSHANEALLRVKPTSPQVGKTAEQRKRNLKGAFKVIDKPAIKGKHIVLVDDVWTTGSTASACAKVLKRAGAKKVSVVTLAFVAPN